MLNWTSKHLAGRLFTRQPINLSGSIIARSFSTCRFSAIPSQFENFNVEQCEMLASQGDVHAQFQLGKYYLVTTDGYHPAREWLTKASAQNHAEAQYLLAFSAYQRRKMNEPSIEAFKLASDNGCQLADQHLGFMYFVGDCVKKDYRQSYYYFTKNTNAKPFTDSNETMTFLANHCIEYLQYLHTELDQKFPTLQIARIYQQATYMDNHHELAFKAFELASENGFVSADYEMARAYYYGRGISQDYSKAFQLFSQMNGMFSSNWFLAVMYLMGRGTKMLPVKSIRLVFNQVGKAVAIIVFACLALMFEYPVACTLVALLLVWKIMKSF